MLIDGDNRGGANVANYCSLDPSTEDEDDDSNNDYYYTNDNNSNGNKLRWVNCDAPLAVVGLDTTLAARDDERSVSDLDSYCVSVGVSLSVGVFLPSV